MREGEAGDEEAKAERPAGSGMPEIYWRAWLPQKRPYARGSVVIVHGAGEHSGRYDGVAGALVGAGYAVYALDHQGHGRSGGPRALVRRMDNALVDVYKLVAGTTQKAGGRPPYLLGHSMGGTIATAFALRWPDKLAGLILSSPLLSLPEVKLPERIALGVLSRVAPRLGVSKVDPSLVSRDPEQVRAYESDPLVHHARLPGPDGRRARQGGASLPEGGAGAGTAAPDHVGRGRPDRLARGSGDALRAGGVRRTRP